MSIREVELFRDSTHTAWGFRLAGGKDLKQSLHIQKVSLGSPSHGELEGGDVLLRVQGYDGAELTHACAQDVIKRAGGSIKMTIKRCGQTSNQHSNFRPQSWHQGQGAYMMLRLQNTLDGAVTNRHNRPLAANRARLTLADWMLHKDAPMVGSPVQSLPEVKWTPVRHPPLPSRNEMGTCFIPSSFSSNAGVKHGNNYRSNDHLKNHHTPQSPSEQPHTPQINPWSNHTFFSGGFSPKPKENSQADVQSPPPFVNHPLPSAINHSKMQYNTPIGLYEDFKGTAFHAISPPCHSLQNNHVESNPHEEVLYQHKVQLR